MQPNDVVWFQLDGEPIHIACFEDEGIVILFQINKIAVGKPPGSTTEVTQPCDKGRSFCSTKCCLKQVKKRDLNKGSAFVQRLQGQLEKAFDEYIADTKHKWISRKATAAAAAAIATSDTVTEIGESDK